MKRGFIGILFLFTLISLVFFSINVSAECTGTPVSNCALYSFPSSGCSLDSPDWVSDFCLSDGDSCIQKPCHLFSDNEGCVLAGCQWAYGDSCGNGVCNADETSTSCPNDCQEGPDGPGGGGNGINIGSNSPIWVIDVNRKLFSLDPAQANPNLILRGTVSGTTSTIRPGDMVYSEGKIWVPRKGGITAVFLENMTYEIFNIPDGLDNSWVPRNSVKYKDNIYTIYDFRSQSSFAGRLYRTSIPSGNQNFAWKRIVSDSIYQLKGIGFLENVLFLGLDSFFTGRINKYSGNPETTTTNLPGELIVDYGSDDGRIFSLHPKNNVELYFGMRKGEIRKVNVETEEVTNILSNTQACGGVNPVVKISSYIGNNGHDYLVWGCDNGRVKAMDLDNPTSVFSLIESNGGDFLRDFEMYGGKIWALKSDGALCSKPLPLAGDSSPTCYSHSALTDGSYLAIYGQECGNSYLDPGETCDDGNFVDGDGCSAFCVIEQGYTHNYVTGDNTSGGVSGQQIVSLNFENIAGGTVINNAGNYDFTKPTAVNCGAQGISGNACEFNAVPGQSRLTMNNANDFYVDFNDEHAGYTVAAWVNPTASPDGIGRIIATNWYASPSINSGERRGWGLGDAWGSEDHMQFFVLDSSGVQYSATYNDFFANYLNQWVYVVGVFKGGQYLKLYVNGQEVAAGGGSSIPNSLAENSNIPITIGQRGDGDGGSGMWHGLIDEVGIWNYALNLSEIQTEYNNFAEGGAGAGTCSQTDDGSTFLGGTTTVGGNFYPDTCLEGEGNQINETKCDSGGLVYDTFACPTDSECITGDDGTGACSFPGGSSNNLVCFVGETNYPIGSRFKVDGVDEYCSPDLSHRSQLETGGDCFNDYECKTNACTGGVCYDLIGEIEEQKSLIQRLYCTVVSFFTSTTYVECMYTEFESESCSETDSGIDYETAGICTGVNGQFADTCGTAGVPSAEYFCNNEDFCQSVDLEPCQNLGYCQAGSCVK